MTNDGKQSPRKLQNDGKQSPRKLQNDGKQSPRKLQNASWFHYYNSLNPATGNVTFNTSVGEDNESIAVQHLQTRQAMCA